MVVRTFLALIGWLEFHIHLLRENKQATPSICGPDQLFSRILVNNGRWAVKE